MKYTAIKDMPKAIASVATSGTKHRELIQNVAVGILNHAVACGDWRKANDLVNALGKGINGKLLVDWFVRHGGLVLSPVKPGKPRFFESWKGKEHIESNIKAAMDDMWWSKDKADHFDSYDAEKAALAFANGFEKRRKQIEKGTYKGNADMVLSGATIQMLARILNLDLIGATDDSEEGPAEAANETTEKPKAKRESA